MSNNTKMRLKTPEEIIKSLLQRYTVHNENVVNVERLFVAASIVRWFFQQTSKPDELIQYLIQVEKHLDGEIELYWEDGVIKRKDKKRGNK